MLQTHTHTQKRGWTKNFNIWRVGVVAPKCSAAAGCPTVIYYLLTYYFVCPVSERLGFYHPGVCPEGESICLWGQSTHEASTVLVWKHSCFVSGLDERTDCVVEHAGKGIRYISGVQILDNNSVNLITTIVMGLLMPRIANMLWPW